QRSIKRLLATVILVVIAVGLAVWLVWFPPWVKPLQQRLLGAWEGTADLSSEWSIAVSPQPDQGVPGGKAAGRITTTSTVFAEFKPDGTYTWKQHDVGNGFRGDFWWPKDDASPSRWTVVDAQGNKLTVRMHLGEVTLDFQGENGFTMNLPES